MSDAPRDPHAASSAERLEHVVDDAAEAESTIDDGEQSRAVEPGRDDELDGLRIRKLATLRRAAYRARSHAVIAAVICAVAAAQLAMMAWRSYHAAGGALDRWTIASAAFVPIAIIGIVYFARRAMTLHEDAWKYSPTEPAEPPDFSTLSDGSDDWKRLNDVR